MTPLLQRFFRTRTRPAKGQFERMAATVLYAHYSRWDYLTSEVCVCDEEEFERRHRVSVADFMAALEERWPSSQTCHGIKLFDLWLLEDAAERRGEKHRPEESRVREEVIITEDLAFAQAVLERGTTVKLMTAIGREKEEIKRLSQRDDEHGTANAASWTVVLWDGKRRYVPSRCLSRPNADS